MRTSARPGFTVVSGDGAAPLALPDPTVTGTNPPQTWAAFLPAYTDT